MRKLTFGLITALLLALAAMFTGCEPNVPEDDNADEATIMSRSDNNDNDRTDAAESTDGMLDEDGTENGMEDGNLDEDDDYGGNEDNGNNGNDEDSAVEGDTPAADFDESTVIMTLSGGRGLTAKLSAADNNDFSHLTNNKIGWGLGAVVDDKNRPLDAVNANRNFGSLGAAFIGESEMPTVYLTFDEGYENGYTAVILDELKRRNARATFFVTYDYCKSSPDLVQRMIDEGHTIGNHSYTHPSFPDCTPEQIREEIGNLHDYVKDTFNYEMRLVRFPMGEFSERSLAVAQSMNYTSVFWSFAYMDWNVNKQPDPATSLEKIKDATHTGGIYLLHAVSSTNAEILGDLLDYWHGEGYALGVIGEGDDDIDSNDDGAVLGENSSVFCIVDFSVYEVG